jgi:predicted O-methyltransferase YrrM/ketosteroid isomerase-like protein
MLRHLFVAACFAAAFVPVRSHAGDLEDLKTAQAKYEAAFKTSDVDTLVNLIHPQFVDYPADGELPVDWAGKTADERRKFFRDLLSPYESWEARLVDTQYRVAGATGIVAGWERVSRKPKLGGIEYPRWRFTSSWTKTDGRWLMLTMHRSTTPATIPGALPLGVDGGEQRILKTALGAPRFANVPLVDARLMRVLAEVANAKQVVELGTSTGFSALWFCAALRRTGGRLTTFELDAGRAKIARDQFRQAGVEAIATLVEGDAHEKIKELKGPIDVLFIDAEKDGYPDYLKQLLPLVRPGGLILAHNMRWPAPSPAYVKAVTEDPTLETVFVNMDDQGLGITLKKR